MTSVCVTGATGFLGAHVARRLCEAGYRVRVTYRDPQRLERLDGLNVEPVEADILDPAALARAFRGAEIVFHVAALVGSRPERLVWELNARAPRVVVEAAGSAGVRRVVHTSTVSTLGPAADRGMATEDDVFARAALGLLYPGSKHAGECEAFAAAVRTGTEVVITNPGYILGPPVDRSALAETSNRFVVNYLRGRLPGVLEGLIDVVDVDDVAHGHLLAAERGRPGHRYILGGHAVSWLELCERIAEVSGVRHPLIVIPRKLATAARALELTGVPAPVRTEGIGLMSADWRGTSEKARRELGYAARPLEQTLADTIAWYRELRESGAIGSGRPSVLSLSAQAVRALDRTKVLACLSPLERLLGRQLVSCPPQRSRNR